MYGSRSTPHDLEQTGMPSFPSPFGSDDNDLFDGYDEFASNHLPRPGEFLESHHLLTGADHVAFHRLTRDCFEERKVYDMVQLQPRAAEPRHPPHERRLPLRR